MSDAILEGYETTEINSAANKLFDGILLPGARISSMRLVGGASDAYLTLSFDTLDSLRSLVDEEIPITRKTINLLGLKPDNKSGGARVMLLSQSPSGSFEKRILISGKENVEKLLLAVVAKAREEQGLARRVKSVRRYMSLGQPARANMKKLLRQGGNLNPKLEHK
jgi:hypothetical protein